MNAPLSQMLVEIPYTLNNGEKLVNETFEHGNLGRRKQGTADPHMMPMMNGRPIAASFTLKDAGSQIDAVMFKGSLNKLKFPPANGLEVIAHGRITVYEARGKYQLNVDAMRRAGLGALYEAFEKLKAKLDNKNVQQ